MTTNIYIVCGVATFLGLRIGVKMSNDIIIVDDDRIILDSIVESLTEFGFNALGFELPSEALAHLKEREYAPFGYLIDMKPYGFIPYNFNFVEYPESPIPEMIFEFVKEKEWQRNFYFMTAGVSDYDCAVLNRTGAEYMTKAPGMDYILKKLHNWNRGGGLM